MIVASWLIGHSSRDDAKRRIGWSLDKIGWGGFVEKSVMPVVEWFQASGLRPRIELHNPAGADKPMSFDQLRRARGLNWVIDGFVDAWRPLDAEKIAYIGSPHNWPEYDTANTSRRLRLFAECVGPYIEAGCTFALDNAPTHDRHSSTWEVAEALAPVYVEATAPFEHREWWGHKQIILEPLYQMRHGPRQRLDASRRFPKFDSDDWYTGEVVRMLTGSRTNPEYARKVVADGHTPMLAAHKIDLSVPATEWTRP